MAVQRLESAASKVDDHFQQLRTALQKLDSTPANERWTLDSQIDGKVNELNTLIGRMGNDVKGTTGGDRDYWDTEIRKYRDDLTDLNTELRQKRSAAQNQLSDTRKSNDEQAQGAISSLDQAIATGRDTSATQDKILTTLADDREHLGNIQRNVEQVDMEADSANVRLKRMFYRAICHKVIVWIVVAVLAGVFVLSAGLKFGVINLSKSPEKTSPPTP
jgi:chromosome segregation ATPase